MIDYYHKYVKYKTKYLQFKNQYGSGNNIAHGNNNLMLKLLKEEKNNIVFSPISITYALALVHQGTGGNTDRELTKLFGQKYSWQDLKTLKELVTNDAIKMTNLILINNDFNVRKNYLQEAEKYAMIKYDNFSNTSKLVKEVNQYIEKNTKGLIKNALPENSLSKLVKLLILNTIYFKANWSKTFKKESTSKMNFITNGKQKMVDMMHQTNDFNYYDDKIVQIIQIDYDKIDFSMIVILPKSNLNLVELNKVLNPDYFNLSKETNKFTTEKIDLYLPKFTQRSKMQLVPF